MNIVFIVVDTLRGDRVGCYGYWRPNISPNMDRIAAEGLLFKDAYASGIATGPGFTCLHTGLNCVHHGFYLTPWNKPNTINFDDTIPVAADFFRDAGYVTAAVDNLMNFMGPMKHMVRGYNYYMNSSRQSGPQHHFVIADEVNAMALPWIRAHARNGHRPFFLFIHYWDTHAPYNHPEPFRNYYHHEKNSLEGLPTVHAKAGYDYVPGWGPAHLIDEGDKYFDYYGPGAKGHDLYDEEVRYVDHAIGQVYETLAEMGILDETCIVITSDHGEALGEHDYWDHKYLDQATTHIPLIIRYPKSLPQGVALSGFTQQVDILPTMLDLAGIEGTAARFDGQSLFARIRGEATARSYAFVEGGGNVTFGRALLEDGWKLITYTDGSAPQLYNLQDDPREIVNLAEAEPTKLKSMLDRLDRLVAQMLDGRPDPIPRFDGDGAAPTRRQSQPQAAMGATGRTR